MPTYIEAISDIYLDNNHGVDLVKHLNDADNNQPGDPRGAIDSFLAKWTVPPDTIAVLGFVKTLLSYTEDDPYICGGFLTLLSVPSLETLAAALFPQNRLDQMLASGSTGFPNDLTAEDLNHVRKKLLDDQPLVVILVMIRDNNDFSLVEALKKSVVVCLLTSMLQRGLKLGSSELLATVQETFIEYASAGDNSSTPTDTDISSASEFVKSLKILSRLVEDPSDIARLYDKSYRSVRSITVQSKEKFKNELVSAGTTAENALRIHDCAERVDCWNEHLWLALMDSGKANSIMLKPPQNTEKAVLPLTSGGGPPESWNNLTDIFRLQNVACDECCSITSMSAYFADLLNLLSNTRSTGGGGSPKPGSSLLNLLSIRRPDLRKLKLSCTNSQTLIPNINLVNEILENFIRNKNQSSLTTLASDQQDSINAFNNPTDAVEIGAEDSHSEGLVYRPGNTDFEVYSKVISKQMFPFTCFPYDHARSSVVEYLKIFQIPYAQLIEAFQAPELILEKITQANRGTLSKEAQKSLDHGTAEVLERQLTASILNLHHREFAAITGESFFPVRFANLLQGLSSDIPPIANGLPVYESYVQWGYENEDTMLDVTDGLGLTFIKRQLMQRSGLDFPDILELVKTQLFGQDLVITHKSGSNEFSDSIEDLRLLSNASQPPFQALTPLICQNLQSFLRLKAKLGWSTRDLDAAIYCLQGREMESSPNFKLPAASDARPISVYVLNGIASIVKLSELCGVEPAALLPLWGPIDSFGKNSLLYRKFLRPSLGPIFAIPQKNDEFFQPKGVKSQIYSCGSSVCASLKWPFPHLKDLLEATGLSGADLSVETLSELYRYVTICRILSVPAGKCTRFFNLFFNEAKEKPLSSPKATLKIIASWRKLLDSNWTIESLVDILETTHAGGVQDSSGLQLTRAILEGSVDLQKSLSFISTPDAIPTSDTIIECAGRTFDSATAKLVVEYIEGTQVRTSSVQLTTEKELEELIEISKGWPDKFSLIPSIEQRSNGKSYSAQLKLRGILITSEKDDILQSKTPSSATTALTALVENSLLPQKIIKSRFEKNPNSQQKLEGNILLDDWVEPPIYESDSSDSSATLSPDLSLIDAEDCLRNRRSAFIDVARPTIIQDLLTSLILNSTKDLLPDIDTAIISSLISDVVRVPTKDGSKFESAMTVLQSFSIIDKDAANATLDAYFTPTTTDDFRIHYAGTNITASNSPEITINGLKMPFDTTSKTWSPFRMIAGQAYLLQAAFDPSQLSWSTTRSMPTPFADEDLLSSETVQQTTLVLEAIRRAALICQTLKFTTAELAFLNRQVQMQFKMLAVDLNSLSLKDMIKLQEYCVLRDRCVPSSKDDNLMGLISWLSSSTGADANAIAAKIAASTGWKDTLLESVLNEKYPNYTPGDLVATLRDYDALLSLKAIVLFYEGLGSTSSMNSMPSITELFDLTRPPQQLDNADIYVKTAQTLQKRLTALQQENFDEGMMEKQRTALVTYLLQQTYIKNLKIWDADGLFEYFLVDVQIGPKLRTSRIKQAISVVQLYVQRCLLGLEENVLMTDLKRDKWEWMQQYTLWEANRKLFLYPENWIDPMLRDDKSQLFDHFEAALLQKDLSIDTFLQAVQSYVYGLSEISKLDIVSYVHEPHENEADIFHFFGQTRTSPYSFHYRTLTVYRGDEIFWQPWTKIEMDIQSFETEWEGHRLENVGSYLFPAIIGGRLYLFMPSIVPKALAKDVGQSLAGVDSFEEFREKPPGIVQPERVWEISMAWTELIKGSWSSKRVSSGSLNVGLLASASQFRIDPTFDTTGKKMKMHINYSMEGGAQFTEIGTFTFFNDQISALISSATSPTEGPFPTYFQKAIGKGMAADSLKIKPNMPLIWIPKTLVYNKQDDLTWTLSKTQKQVTALVVSTKDTDGMSTSYFNLPKKGLIPTATRVWDNDKVEDDTELVLLDHLFSHELMEAAAASVDPLGLLYNKLASMPSDDLRESFGAGGQAALYHELARPTSIYNWEIGMHTVFLAVDRLFTTQQYDEALQIARLIFDPSVEIDVVRFNGDAKVSSHTCWRFPPFQELACRIAHQSKDTSDPLSLVNLKIEIQNAITERRSYGALVHAAARGRPVSYMKWIVMKYAEILIALGDIQFRRGTSECLPLATQRYIEAARVLGPEPPNVPDLGNRKAKVLTFEQLRESDIQFDEVSLDLGLPFSPKLMKGAAVTADNDPIVCFLKTGYFCVPLNPKFKMMRSLVHERLFNLRNSFDISGKPVVYALRDPPIDPGDLVALSNQGLSISDVLGVVSGERDGPLTHQRFGTLMRAALGLCTEVRSLGERLLTAIEKKDAEELSISNVQSSIAVQQMMANIKKLELDEAQQNVESLYIDRSSQEAQLNYYLRLIGEPDTKIPKPGDEWTDIPQNIDVISMDELRVSPYEKLEMSLSLAASAQNKLATNMDAVAIPLYLIPTIQTEIEPFGVGMSISGGGTAIAETIAASSTLMKGLAGLYADQAARADKKASLTTQLQERRLQANISGRGIKSIDKQIEIQKIRIKSVQKDLDMQKYNLESDIQTEAWYHSKYTNKQLYGWMEKRLRNLYLQAYDLVLSAALRAESAFIFEGGRKSSIIKRGGYWDASRDGLLAAEDLYWDLKKLEAAQAEGTSADYNITKTVSLKEIDPMALMNFRITGTCNFSLDELLFDMDFPGHYMRRIRSVGVTIPAAFESNSNANAILTLLQHKYRVTQSAADYAASQSSSSESFRTDRIPTSSIAVSSGNVDSGVFELDFSGSQYMPFEGAGAISKWRLELPTPVRTFNYESITDVLLRVQYTAYEGGPSLRAAANDATFNVMKAAGAEGQQKGFSAVFDLKNEFADEWTGFGNQLLAETSSGASPSMNLGDLKSHLPYWSRRQDALEVRNITFMSRSKALLDRLKISSVVVASWDASKNTDYFAKACTVTETDLKWKIEAGKSQTTWDANGLENVFILIHYVFVGSKIV